MLCLGWRAFLFFFNLRTIKSVSLRCLSYIETALCPGCGFAGLGVSFWFFNLLHPPCVGTLPFFLVPFRYYSALLRGGTLFDIALCGFCRVGSLGFLLLGSAAGGRLFFLPYYRGISGTDFRLQNYEKKLFHKKNFYISKIFIFGGLGINMLSYKKNFSSTDLLPDPSPFSTK